ncbi:Kelch-type beta propeller [Phytophthora cactorum]|nr:Kelch-type beta propeller [Phytophthora cactorum]
MLSSPESSGGYEAFGSFHTPSTSSLFDQDDAESDIKMVWESDIALQRLQLQANSVANAPNRSLFALDLQKWTYLNHGAFGAPTKGIKSLAGFIGVSNPKKLVLLPNATAGLHSVLASVLRGEEEEVVLFSTRYGAVRKMLQAIEGGNGSVYVHEEPLSLEESYDDQKVMERLEKALDAVQASGRQVTLVVVDHITSNTAVTMPVKEIVQRCHDQGSGIPVLVDGAHGLLNLHLISTILAPTTTLATPRVISHGFFDGMQSAFMWTGLQDYSAWLALPQCLAFWRRQGVTATREYMHSLAQEAAKLLYSRWEMPGHLARERQVPQHKRHAMRLVQLPTSRRLCGGVVVDGKDPKATSTDAKRVQDSLHYRHNIEVPVKCVDGRLYVRLSAHVYNCLEHFEKLAASLVQVDRQVYAELLRVAPGNPGSAAALVSWSAFDNALEATGGTASVEAYEVQYAVSGSGAWQSLGDSLTGYRVDLGAQATDQVPKQQTISDGDFRLTLSYEGSSQSLMGGRAMAGVVTPPIAFDATIESLEQITKVQVLRNALDANGAFEWVILFDTWPTTAKIHGDQVAVQYLRMASSSPDQHRRICSDECSYEVTGLQTGRAFTFRVRAQYSYDIGWSSWSASSEPLEIPATRLPRAPSAPEFLAATTSHVTISWRMRRELTQENGIFAKELFPVTSFHAQQQCDSEIGWTTIRERVTPGFSGNSDTFSTVVASLERPPGSTCVFRVAATNVNGQGPYSLASAKFTTFRTAPGPVLNLRVLRDPLTVVWETPADLGGHTKEELTCDVEYRTTLGSTWTRLPVDLVDCSKRTANVSMASLKGYTAYVARVRAVVKRQAGSFSQSAEFLTDYTVEEESSSDSKDFTLGTRQVAIAATRQHCANQQDWYYVQMTGNGGSGGSTNGVQAEPGENGAVLVFPVTWSGERLAERSFFFTGGAQTYRVPVEQYVTHLALRIVALDIYAWGAGGAGARSSNGASSDLVVGATTMVVGDLTAAVTAVQAIFLAEAAEELLVAAGGGGAGSTDYCCAHGGGGGGLDQAESGLAADATAIPLDLSVTGQADRDEYHSSNVAGDTRDFEGLPARHEHLDWGFAASSADYSVLATGGTGATPTSQALLGLQCLLLQQRIGLPMVNVDVVVVDKAANKQVEEQVEGSLVEEEEAQAFVSFIDLFNSSKTGISDASLRPRVAGEAVRQLQVSPLTSSSVSVSWKAPRYGFSQLVEGFVIEMANRSASEDFRLVRLVTLPTADMTESSGNVTVHGLAPMAAYRFRVKPLLLDGPEKYVETLRYSTCRRREHKSWDAVTNTPPLQRLPSARRGHSLTFMDNFLYLFGGMAKSYECSRAHKVPCLVQKNPRSVSNELWRYDLLTETWWSVPQPTLAPPPREKHSMADDASDANDASTWGPQALNDLWELSISSTTAKQTSVSLDSRQPTTLSIPDGGEVFALGRKRVSASGEQLCVANVSVTVQITHACPQKLRLQLFGPGPATFPGRQQSLHFPADSQTRETSWSDSQGLKSFQGDQRTTGTAPIPEPFQCCYVVQKKQQTSSAGVSGTPLEALSVFHQLPVAGNWTLELADTAADGLVGTLKSWDVAFDVAPCVPAFTWTNLSPIATGTAPTARFQHSVVVFESSMFVFGGSAGGSGVELSDLYRLDYTPSVAFGVAPTARWTQLASLTDSESPSIAERRVHAGRVTLLTPYELMGVGRGLKPPRRASLGSNKALSACRFESQLDVRLKRLEDLIDGWSIVATTSQDDMVPTDEQRPVPRYWGASAFAFPPPDSSVPRVFLFGGQDDTTLLDDLWSLELGQLAEDFPRDRLQTQRIRACAWRQENSAYRTQWTSSCGASSTTAATNKCTLEMLLFYAWCEEYYQSIVL